MRCKYCGWDNPPGSSNCCKCNQILSEEHYMGQSARANVQEADLRKTVNESDVFPDNEQEKSNECVHCKYPVRTGVRTCPSCGASQIKRETKREVLQDDAGFSRRTIRPGKRSQCALTLIPEEKEKMTPCDLSFSGEEIVLNRDNTEPDNLTITSKEQAVLTYEGKRWYIQDRSELKTTYVQASEKIELKPGDIILLGDRQFQFDC